LTILNLPGLLVFPYRAKNNARLFVLIMSTIVPNSNQTCGRCPKEFLKPHAFATDEMRPRARVSFKKKTDPGNSAAHPATLDFDRGQPAPFLQDKIQFPPALEPVAHADLLPDCRRRQMSADRGLHQPAPSRRVRTDCLEIRRRHCAHQGRIQHLEFWARRPSPDRSR